MKFLGEMKRRHVFRNGLFYILTAWLLVQFGQVLAEDTATGWRMTEAGVFAGITTAHDGFTKGVMGLIHCLWLSSTYAGNTVSTCSP